MQEVQSKGESVGKMVNIDVPYPNHVVYFVLTSTLKWAQVRNGRILNIHNYGTPTRVNKNGLKLGGR